MKMVKSQMSNCDIKKCCDINLHVHVKTEKPAELLHDPVIFEFYQVFVVFSPFVTWCSVMQLNHHFIHRSVCVSAYTMLQTCISVKVSVSERGLAGVSDSESCKELWPTISKTKPSAADWTNFSENSESNNNKHCPNYDRHLWESKQNKSQLQEAKHFFFHLILFCHI